MLGLQEVVLCRTSLYMCDKPFYAIESMVQQNNRVFHITQFDKVRFAQVPRTSSGFAANRL